VQTFATALDTRVDGGGTTRWMAPELFEAGAVKSRQADIYALGMTMLEVSNCIICNMATPYFSRYSLEKFPILIWSMMVKSSWQFQKKYFLHNQILVLHVASVMKYGRSCLSVGEMMVPDPLLT
jgi:serine/threonine protein kinase